MKTEKTLEFCREQVARFGVCYPAGWVSGMSETAHDRLSANREEYFEELARALFFAADDNTQAERIVRAWIYNHTCWPRPNELVALARFMEGPFIEKAIEFCAGHIARVEQLKTMLANLGTDIPEDSPGEFYAKFEQLRDSSLGIQDAFVSMVHRMEKVPWKPEGHLQ